MPSQPVVAQFITFSPVAHVMRNAIDLDGQLRPGAEEVDDIGAGGVLAPEFQAAGALAQVLPEQDFGQRQAAAQTGGAALDGLRAVKHCLAYPSTVLRTVPLPLQGRIW